MSRLNIFFAAICRIITQLGGSHLTRESRMRWAWIFARTLMEGGFTHLRDLSQLKPKHIKYYFNERLPICSLRTLQNEASHLRRTLRAAGLSALASSTEISNTSLQIAGGSRRGRRQPLSDVELAQVKTRSEKTRRPGMFALVCLERCLGLRGNEAIHSRSDTLTRWRKEILAEGVVHVIAGTKGGKSRRVRIFERESALAAIEHALQIADKQGGYLVTRRNGDPTGGLKEARQIYHSWVSRAGIAPHAARYAFAQAQLEFYQATGFSLREAYQAVSLDLGHGDGRGRWIKLVYGQRPAPSEGAG